MTKVTVYRGEGFTGSAALIAVSGDVFASAQENSPAGREMSERETFKNMNYWTCRRLSKAPSWFQDQLTPDNIVWEAYL